MGAPGRIGRAALLRVAPLRRARGRRRARWWSPSPASPSRAATTRTCSTTGRRRPRAASRPSVGLRFRDHLWSFAPSTAATSSRTSGCSRTGSGTTAASLDCSTRDADAARSRCRATLRGAYAFDPVGLAQMGIFRTGRERRVHPPGARRGEYRATERVIVATSSRSESVRFEDARAARCTQPASRRLPADRERLTLGGAYASACSRTSGSDGARWRTPMASGRGRGTGSRASSTLDARAPVPRCGRAPTDVRGAEAGGELVAPHGTGTCGPRWPTGSGSDRRRRPGLVNSRGARGRAQVRPPRSSARRRGHLAARGAPTGRRGRDARVRRLWRGGMPRQGRGAPGAGGDTFRAARRLRRPRSGVRPSDSGSAGSCRTGEGGRRNGTDLHAAGSRWLRCGGGAASRSGRRRAVLVVGVALALASRPSTPPSSVVQIEPRRLAARLLPGPERVTPFEDRMRTIKHGILARPVLERVMKETDFFPDLRDDMDGAVRSDCGGNVEVRLEGEVPAGPPALLFVVEVRGRDPEKVASAAELLPKLLRGDDARGARGSGARLCARRSTRRSPRWAKARGAGRAEAPRVQAGARGRAARVARGQRARRRPCAGADGDAARRDRRTRSGAGRRCSATIPEGLSGPGLAEASLDAALRKAPGGRGRVRAGSSRREARPPRVAGGARPARQALEKFQKERVEEAASPASTPRWAGTRPQIASLQQGDRRDSRSGSRRRRAGARSSRTLSRDYEMLRAKYVTTVSRRADAAAAEQLLAADQPTTVPGGGDRRSRRGARRRRTGRSSSWIAVLAGARAAALGAAALAEWLDGSMRGPEDAASLGVPVLAAIPRIDRRRARSARYRRRNGPMIPAETLQATHPAAAPEKRLVALAAPESPAAEQYRVLYQRLARLAARRPMRVVAVTSAGRGEGRTTTAANLALIAAQEGAPVVLVEADLRRPSLASLFGLAPRAGLAEVLDGTAELSQAVVRVGALSVLCAGEVRDPRPRSAHRAHRRPGGSAARRLRPRRPRRAARARLRRRRAARGRCGRGGARGARRGDAAPGGGARAGGAR